MIAATDVLRVLFLEDYNTRLVVLGTALLGAVSGLIGSFMLLRRRALLGDTLSHATLPGIAAAFLIATASGGEGRSLTVLLLGATISGLLGVGLVVLIRSQTRLKDDAALGIALSVLFGFGVVLMRFVQEVPAAGKAGLQSFIYGKTASMVAGDVNVMLVAGIIAAGLCILFLRPLTMLCFDATFMRTLGWPRWFFDLLLMTLVTLVVVVGLQAVGLILVIAMLIIPAATASFWTHRLRQMLIISAGIGVLSGWGGAMASALVRDLPAGAIIVLVAAALFGVSMLLAPARGVLWRAAEHWRLSRTVARQHLLRAAYELKESRHDITIDALLQRRSWSRAACLRTVRRAQRDSVVRFSAHSSVVELTPSGLEQARHLTRRHRLWELFLIRHADIAPSHVDRAADDIEHVLDADLVRALEAELDAELVAADDMPQDPHHVAPDADDGGAP